VNNPRLTLAFAPLFRSRWRIIYQVLPQRQPAGIFPAIYIRFLLISTPRTFQVFPRGMRVIGKRECSEVTFRDDRSSRLSSAITSRRVARARLACVDVLDEQSTRDSKMPKFLLRTRIQRGYEYLESYHARIDM